MIGNVMKNVNDSFERENPFIIENKKDFFAYKMHKTF